MRSLKEGRLKTEELRQEVRKALKTNAGEGKT